MLPEFLHEFQAGLEKYRLDCISILAAPLGPEESTGITESKFSGFPYLPVNMEYPKDQNHIPMLLLAQINFAETPKHPDYPEHGILQFFVSKDWTSIGVDEENDHKNYRVLFHEEVEPVHQTDFSFLTSELMIESPVISEHRLTFAPKTEFGGSEDFRFDFEFNGLDIYDYSKQLNEEQQNQLYKFFSCDGHKIGGYAYFTQEDDRAYDDEKSDDVPILQMDSDEHIMIGDVGVAHFFINADDLRDRKFENAYFQWDCC